LFSRIFEGRRLFETGNNTMKFITLFILNLILALALSVPVFAQQNGSLSGQVQDSLGAVVVGATVTVVAADGKEKTTTSNQRGEFSMSGLAPGKYTVKVKAAKFALYENAEVEVTVATRTELTVPLTVEAMEEQVDVSESGTVSTDPQNNAGATVLKEKDLDALPDDPDELEAALQALAGASAGPNGGQIYIDGFTGGQLPPKESIREIRINSNPFSAEYERLGFGRIEILTKPGSDKFRGSVFGNFNDESLNSRNPFSLNRAPSQMRAFGGNLSGPIIKGKMSYFLDINNRDNDNNSVLNAVILDSNLNPVNLREDFTVPSSRFSFSPRIDYAINDKNTLVARYSYGRNTQENLGIGGTSLPERAYVSTNTEHELRLTETMIINPKTVNETRFEFDLEDRNQEGDNSIPTINVADSFTSGGSQIGLSFNKARTWELQNYTTTSFGKNAQHAFKFGVRVRSTTIKDRSENNFGGTFSFPGAPMVTDPEGCNPFDEEDPEPCTIVAEAVSPLDQYRGKLLGNSDIRYLPTQFTITTGNPLQEVSRTDYNFFATDDWRVSPALMLSFGLRYENQTNISDNGNFAPRLSFAWSPGAGGAKTPKTVFRGGFGIFYDRFSENLTLNALRFGGDEQLSQLSLVVNALDSDPERREDAIELLQQPVFTLNGVTNVPTAAQILAALPQSNTLRTIAPDIQSPYMFQTALSVERQLPMRMTVSVTYVGARTVHVLRARNINAPICPDQIECENAQRPDPTQGNVYQYESTGTLNQNQLMVNFRSNYSQRLSFFGFYRLGFANGDSDGAGSFPAYSYDLSNEYGRSSFDQRHSFVIGGNVTLPYRISLNPFVMLNSGRPFNITRGIDLNGDALNTERPTFGDLSAKCIEMGITASYCDVAGQDPDEIIPRYWGQSPNYFSVNLRIGKTFGFGKSPDSVQASSGGQGGGRQGGGRRDGGGGAGPGGGGRVVMAGGGGGGMGGFFGGGDVRKPYNLNLSLSINNLFNNVNFGSPVGNLSSSRFGQSTSTIGGGFGGFGGGGGGGSANRKIELSARFSW
jgi:hypothetical protein